MIRTSLRYEPELPPSVDRLRTHRDIESVGIPRFFRRRRSGYETLIDGQNDHFE